MKTCTKCKVEKPLEDFHRHGSGRRPDCKACNRTAALARYDPLARWAYRLHREYGLSTADYDAMLAAQGGVCAICAADRPGRGDEHFHVDHDHATGAVRGLLCTNCNRAIGWMADDPARLERAAAYLRDRS